MENNKNDLKKDFKIVFNAGFARKLLRAGCTIADVKKSKENPDKTIFVFKRDEIFEKAFAEFNDELKKHDDAQVCHE